MYTKTVACKDLYGKPANVTVHFNLFEREVIKLLLQFKAIFEWRDKINTVDAMNLDTAEVVEFFNNFEDIVLSAYGTPTDNGMGFSHDERYKFEESVVFNALMIECLKDPAETSKLIDGIMPAGFEDIVKAADENLAKVAAESTDAELRAEIERLRAQVTATQTPEAEAS